MTQRRSPTIPWLLRMSFTKLSCTRSGGSSPKVPKASSTLSAQTALGATAVHYVSLSAVQAYRTPPIVNANGLRDAGISSSHMRRTGGWSVRGSAKRSLSRTRILRFALLLSDGGAGRLSRSLHRPLSAVGVFSFGPWVARSSYRFGPGLSCPLSGSPSSAPLAAVNPRYATAISPSFRVPWTAPESLPLRLGGVSRLRAPHSLGRVPRYVLVRHFRAHLPGSCEGSIPHVVLCSGAHGPQGGCSVGPGGPSAAVRAPARTAAASPPFLLGYLLRPGRLGMTGVPAPRLPARRSLWTRVVSSRGGCCVCACDPRVFFLSRSS